VAQQRNNTIVLIDLENLIEGYALPKGGAQRVPLRRILLDLCDVEGIRGFAVLRAYANWSDPRLGALRGEMNALGVEPVQVFGLGKNGAKNVADIQLAVDAVDLAHVRPALDTFVIVSGDGGFSALAKKLREYGKAVIGAGYRSSTNKVLAALCDTFVWIEGQEGQAPQDEPLSALTNPRNEGFADNFEPLDAAWTLEAGQRAVRAALRWYGEQIRGRHREGLPLSVPREGIGYLLPGFKPKRLGSATFSKLLARVAGGTPLCVAERADGVRVLALRAALPTGARIIGAEPLPEPDSEEHYRTILGHGSPVLSFPDPEALAAVIAWLEARGPVRATFSELLAGCAADVGPEVDDRAVKRAILLLVHAGVFDREPEGARLGSQTLLSSVRGASARAIRDTLFRCALDRLEEDLEVVDLEVLRGLTHG